jgi:hypothetical protein
MQQIRTGAGLAEWENRKQTVANKFQYFSAMSRNRLRYRVEIAVQKIDDVIARPVVRNRGKRRIDDDVSVMHQCRHHPIWIKGQVPIAQMVSACELNGLVGPRQFFLKQRHSDLLAAC